MPDATLPARPAPPLRRRLALVSCVCASLAISCVAFDFSRQMVLKRQLQSIVDAATIVAASEYSRAKDAGRIRRQGRVSVQKLIPDTKNGDGRQATIEFDFQLTQVNATISESVTNIFGRYYGVPSSVLQARATVHLNEERFF